MDMAYAGKDERLKPFYRHETGLEHFKEVIAQRSSFPTDRAALVAALMKQYEGLRAIPAVDLQIASLEQHTTFTVTTAHQPCLFTGPLYYIYKIFSTIHLADQLNGAYPAYHFVPVFVSGAEDHDFEEINKAHLFHKTITWENNETGATGMMSTSSLLPALETLKEVLGDTGKKVYELIETAYTSHATFGRATVHLLHELFGPYGLVVLDGNSPGLKRLFVPLMEKELMQQPSKSLIERTQARLEAAGFSAQAHARDINLFYMRDQLRERIVWEDGHFKVLNSGYVFSREAMQDELHRHPEYFSPNVVMRPLYQEVILPNLAYIGGGGEIAYWLERNEHFSHFGVPFPMLIRRNSVWWIDRNGAKRIEKLGLKPQDLFEDTESLIKRYIAGNTDHEISLAAEMEQIREAFAHILQKAIVIDPTLEKSVLAEQAKQINGIEHLETRILRAEKQRQETAVQQIRSLKERYFPGNGLQERHENFLPLYLQHGRAFFDTLRIHLNPLESGFIIITET